MARRLRRAGQATGDAHLPATAILATYIRRWEHGKIAPTERYRLNGPRLGQFRGRERITLPPAA
jgi:hypothetical protein